MSGWDEFLHVVKKVGDTVSTALNPVGAITESVIGQSSPADIVFETLSSVAAPDLAVAQNLFGQVVDSALYASKKNDAEEHAKPYESLIRQFVDEADSFTGLAGVLVKSAKDGDSAKAQQAIKAALGEASGVMSEIKRLSSADLLTLTFEIGGQADLIAGVDGSVGYAVGVPDVLDAKPYASAGITLGAEEGGDVGIVVGMSPQKPKKQSGPFVAIIVEVDAALGGGIAVSFNLPEMSFGGVSVAIEAGEELQVSGSGGYTWAL